MRAWPRPSMACVLALCIAGAAQAQPRPRELGRVEFETSCANCHGMAGKGNGPLAAYLTRAPTDLTTLARRNGGLFPVQRVIEIIDGRTAAEIGPHGPRDMPVWGTVYRGQVPGAGDAELAPEWTARVKLAALADYLARLQQ